MQEDIRTMKRIGRNIKHQKGKRGLGTGNFNPLRGMSQREIAKKHGKVKVYDMTKILTKEEFKQLDDSMKKLHMDSWRMRFTNNEIIKGMGVSPATFYKTCNKLGVVMDKRSNNRPPKAKKESVIVYSKCRPAHKAGTSESRKCSLYITEGDSAKALAVGGLGVIGRDNYGVFPLKV